MVCSERKPWVGGNWKCYGSYKSTEELCANFNHADVDASKIDVVIFPAVIHMEHVSKLLDKKKFHIGAQHISEKGYGAFTGETSIEMIKDAGYQWSLVGHSERRQYYHETDEIVAEKVAALQKQKVYTVVCIGETLQQREKKETEKILAVQLEAIIPSVKDWSTVIIAYEPVWAIGTGVVATPEIAQETHQYIRKFLKNKLKIDNIRIVYGGSVSAKNCEQLAKMSDIDGFLVGGASLKPEFVQIIDSCIHEYKKKMESK